MSRPYTYSGENDNDKDARLEIAKGANFSFLCCIFWGGEITNHLVPSIFPQSYRACDIFSWPYAPFVVRGRPPNTK